MNLVLQAVWVFEADPEEASLILRALGGRLITEEDKEEAKALSDKLTVIRYEQAQHLAHQMEKHAKKVPT